MEVIKLPVKSLIQCRSVSKTWKSLIDSPNFISAHTFHQTHPQHLMVSYIDPIETNRNYVSILDDDVTFPHQKSVLSFPLSVNQLQYSTIIGTSNGLFCFECSVNSGLNIAVIWNPSIQKSVDVVVPDLLEDEDYDSTFLGFGVCPDTLDPKIVNILCIRHCIKVEVFTLSSRIWRPALCSNNNLPHKDYIFVESQVVLCGLIYWVAYNCLMATMWNVIISFDLISEEFKEIFLPNSLLYHPAYYMWLSKLRESLVVLQYPTNRHSCAVWMMEPGVENSYKRLYTITLPHTFIGKVLGFRKNGAPIICIQEANRWIKDELAVYDLDLELINKIVVDGKEFSVFGCFYVETLLLLGH